MNLIEFANSHPIVTTLCYCATAAYLLLSLGLITYVVVLWVQNEKEAGSALWDEE